jgi:hypothetical protein
MFQASSDFARDGKGAISLIKNRSYRAERA